MKHPSNRELFDYWNERRGERLAPERADIEPGAIRQVLGDTFVLEVDGRPAIRSASPAPGSARCSAASSRARASSSCGSARPDRDARTDRGGDGGEGRRRRQRHRRDRRRHAAAGQSRNAAAAARLPSRAARPACSGALAPMAAPYWLGAKAIGPLTLGMFRHVGAGRRRRRRAALPGRGAAGCRHGLTVYDGGRSRISAIIRRYRQSRG